MLEANVFLIPHHGARLDSTSDDQDVLRQLLDAVGAGYHVISVGFRNSYDHPHPRLLEEVARRPNARLMCTQINTTCLGDADLQAVQDAGESLPAASDGAGLNRRLALALEALSFRSPRSPWSLVRQLTTIAR
jgi:hypothetical protein